MLTSLDSAIEHLLKHSKSSGSVRLSSTSTGVTDQIQPGTSAGVKRKYIRDVEPDECKLFAISDTESVFSRFQWDTIQENIARDPQAVRSNLEHILLAAIKLNEICEDPDAQKRIESLVARLDDLQINLDYLDTTYQSNKEELDQLSRIAAEQASRDRTHQQETQRQKSSSSVPVATASSSRQESQSSEMEPEPNVQREQDEMEIKRLEDAIEAKRQELARYQESLESTRIAIISERTSDIETTTADPDSSHLPIQGTAQGDPLSSLRNRVQSILYGRTTVETPIEGRLRAARHELLSVILSDLEIPGATAEAKVMAKIMKILEDKGDDGMSLADLRETANGYAVSLGLRDNVGTQAIYRLSAFKFVIIDRSQKESIVKLV